MPKLRAQSGEDLQRIFNTFGFLPFTQRGSHVKLRRVLAGGVRQTLTIPLHLEVDKGTIRAIYRQALRFIPDADLRPHFHTTE
jgi:predicted RNA binding protein YcfA (HicA-like mRNA interferase family)